MLLNYEYEHDPCPFVFGRTPPWALEAGIPEYTYHEKVNQPHSRVRCLGHTRLRTAADLPFIPCQELGETWRAPHFVSEWVCRLVRVLLCPSLRLYLAYVLRVRYIFFFVYCFFLFLHSPSPADAACGCWPCWLFLSVQWAPAKQRSGRVLSLLVVCDHNEPLQRGDWLPVCVDFACVPHICLFGLCEPVEMPVTWESTQKGKRWDHLGCGSLLVCCHCLYSIFVFVFSFLFWLGVCLSDLFTTKSGS